ncbi:MAG TPA: Coenzyme F420 hydrogenase/dehydrogenase, beta subunit C-terminal domain [Deltaproteobacteria bacterium]|mgnify:CR=1 FL=1|nr:Coenzyme F420 hydrogenase/dehydrogenase, beta subunit C-terminal domain [Deltaproteobacteria bacterium]
MGCGICAAICPHEGIRMRFSQTYGCYVPSVSFEECEEGCGVCARACPFAPDNPNTVDVTERLFGEKQDIRHDDVLGYYLQTFAGYSAEHRLKSASGGLLTRMLESLLSRGEIDGAICVGHDPGSPTLFDFRICSNAEDIRSCSGSCYQPVEMSRALRQVLDHDGRFAVVALPCTARGLRLAMEENPELRARIRFILGLVCGQMKSRHLVEYLSRNIAHREFPTEVSFRLKRLNRPANDYAFRLNWKDDYLDIEKNGRARLWGERWFTLEACDYCDDVFCECADAAFMDAWLPEYTADPLGHSLVIVRNEVLLGLLNQVDDPGLIIDRIDPGKVILSQAGVIHQKRRMAAYRPVPVHSKHIPRLRMAQWKWRPDYALEAWMKSRIRCMTEYGVHGNTGSGAHLVGLMSSAWNMVKTFIELAAHVRRIMRPRA